MESSCWYRFGDLLEPVRRLADNSVVYAAGDGIAGATLSALAGHVPHAYLQLMLEGVAPWAVGDLPSLAEMSPRLISENLCPLTGVRFDFDVRLRQGASRRVSRALVCAELQLTDRPDGPPPMAKLAEVQQAYERGLLDELHRSKAHFRLGIRPLVAQLAALRDSGYVPGWRLNALFSTWRDEDSRDWLVEPLDADGAPLDDCELSFLPVTRERSFRVSDLFTPR